MRIIGGTHRGRKIETVADDSVRPTSDRLREAIFNILLHRYTHTDGTPLLQGAVVADIFCGSGAWGLEALSRGAAHCVFNDNNPKALAMARQNASILGCTENATFSHQNAQDLLACSLVPTLFFCDPPYHQNLIAPTLRALQQRGAIAPHSLIITETSKEEVLELPFTLDLTREYGKSKVQFWVA